MRCDRRNVDDRAPAASAHRAEHALSRYERRRQIQRERILPIGKRQGFERTPRPTAHVVDENVDALLLRIDACQYGRELGWLRGIRGIRLTSDLARERFRALECKIDDDYARPIASELTSDRRTDAARATCHDDELARELTDVHGCSTNRRHACCSAKRSRTYPLSRRARSALAEQDQGAA